MSQPVDMLNLLDDDDDDDDVEVSLALLHCVNGFNNASHVLVRHAGVPT